MFKNIIKNIFNKTITATRSSGGEFLLKKTDFGLIRVEFSVVKKIAERALHSVTEIKEPEIIVEKLSVANPLKIRLTTSLSEGYSAPRASEAADKAINDALRKFLKLEFYVPVEVRIKQIAQASTKRRRVR